MEMHMAEAENEGTNCGAGTDNSVSSEAVVDNSSIFGSR